MALASNGRGPRRLLVPVLLITSMICANSSRSPGPEAAQGGGEAVGALPALVPQPVSFVRAGSGALAITPDTVIEIPPGRTDLAALARGLAELLRPALGATVPVREAAAAAPAGAIRLEVAAAASDAGEGYELAIEATGIRLTGSTAAGVFYGLQTLRQLLPPSIELRGARPHALSVPLVRIADRPRFAWRGAMLDVARHFFGVEDVKRYIDLLALYKFNRLHLHLSDDQGWRIEIAAWPNLTAHGGRTAVGGGAGGFYSKREYAEIVAHAASRFITIVPEIDMPGHVNAALASYPELTCDGKAPALYTGIDVGFSALCVEKEATYRFIDDIVREIAAMTPGPYFHIGGDEVKTLTPAQYAQFVVRVQEIVRKHGKQAVGWDEVAHATLLPSTIVQYWRPDASITPAPGTQLILSPANRLYLDMKYDKSTVLGLEWAGHVGVSVPYEWDPATLLPGVAAPSILGIEAPIWSETLVSMDDVEYMAFPRLAAVAEVAWSPQASRRWSEFAERLARQAPRWSALGINAYWSPDIAWQR